MLIRNPWGQGKEWKGAFSEFSQVWDKYPGLKEQLGKKAGSWWMTF